MPRRPAPVTQADVSRGLAFHDLPLFATDAELGQALLGPARAGEWKDIAPLFELRGLPKIDPVMGGRYTPNVLRFFEAEHTIKDHTGKVVPLAPKGVENPDGWKTSGRKHRA